MKPSKVFSLATLLLVVIALAGCAGQAAADKTYTDPFAYCAAVGTIDAPGATYAGDKVPDSVANALLKALGSPGIPTDMIQNGSSWRCMDGKVYGCFVGANLPCGEKADTGKTPTEEMKDFCAQNSNSDVIPAVVTGRATVYEWRCTNGAPAVVKQVAQPDKRGFLSNIWYALSKP